MYQILSEDELLFCEDFCFSRCAGEILFSDLDNTSLMEDEKMIHVRLSQIVLLSHEYVLDDDPKRTRKENFQLKKGSSDCYALGGRNFGKCEYVESKCLLANGQYKKFRDLIGTKQKIISLNQETLKLEEDYAEFYDNGFKDCWKVSLKNGKSLIITENHPLLTDLGWKKCSELTTDNFIGIPSKYQIEGKLEVEWQLAALLGYLLGDGGCSTSNVKFTNINDELNQEYEKIANYYGCDLRREKITYAAKKSKFFVNSSTLLLESKTRKNNLDKIVLKYGINTLSKNKKIPEEVFLWKNEYIAILLNRLFACDGYVCRGNNIVGISLASKEMIYQISSLLLRFGIQSRIYKKKSKCNGKIFNSWALNICRDVKKFIDLIGIKSKEDNFDSRELQFVKSDLIPKNIILSLYDKFENKKESQARHLKKYNPSRNKCLRRNEIIKNQEFQKILDSDIAWEKIKDIEYVGILPTVAVSVPRNNTYISNDIISHNTAISQLLDLLIRFVLSNNMRIGFSSYDFIHIKGVLESAIPPLKYHPVLREFVTQINRSTNYRFAFKNGNNLVSINMNIMGREPGKQFFQNHLHVLYIDEWSMETEEVQRLRRDSVSELGCIFRFCGMTNFTRWTPSGKVFYDPILRKQVVNHPQFVNPNWNDREKERAIKDFSGESSFGYRVFVKGEVVEDGLSVFDSERLKKCYDEEKTTRYFEINKENYPDFEYNLYLEKPKNADLTYIFADIGETAPTEIGIIFKIGDKYRYVYNITLFNLTDKEQFPVFRFLAEKIEANYIALDTTDGTGRAIFRSLEEIYPKENLIWVSFGEKIPVDFEKDEHTGEYILKDGKPVPKEEYVSEWSVKHLKDLFYAEKIIIPMDYKLIEQLSSVQEIRSNTKSQVQVRKIYKCISSSGDHIFQAFQVFSIAHWLTEENYSKPIVRKKHYKGI